MDEISFLMLLAEAAEAVMNERSALRSFSHLFAEATGSAAYDG